jgi:magnesium chelatase subunit D
MSKSTKTVQVSSSCPPEYPFSAVVGQEEMKLALILNVIDSSVGGALMMGHRGTGKSTVVRAIADLLPQISRVAGCAYGCDPGDDENFCAECRETIGSGTKLRRQQSAVSVVELPLGATEDRVCGTIDVEQALRSGVKRFQPGLLARANRGFLYIDEVNLLEDHLVDLLLDVAASGVNKVERESISVEHPARFVLIGSGNPEEGELRPQLLDRFGLYVEVKTEEGLAQRMEIVERREAFNHDREAFRRAFANEQAQLRRKIERARTSVVKVNVDRRVLTNIVQLCSELKIDGHRGELTITRAARALAAFEGRKKATDNDVKRVAVMSLRHRLRRDPMEGTASSERIEEALEKVFAKAGGPVREGEGETGGSSVSHLPSKARGMSASTAGGGKSFVNANGNRDKNPEGNIGAEVDSEFGPVPADKADLPKLVFNKYSKPRAGQVTSQVQSGRGTGVKRAVYDRKRGRYTRSVGVTKAAAVVALDATLRALLSSRFQVPGSKSSSDLSSFATTSPPQRLTPAAADSLRFKLFKRKQGRLFIFAIDLSGSMALNRIVQAKGTMHSLLRQSYLERDSVAIVGFRGITAELLLQPSRSILRARRVLDSVSVGGGTPLSAGLACSLLLAKRTASKSGEVVVLLFTDGSANVALGGNGINHPDTRQEIINKEIALLGVQLRKAGVTLIVIDTQNQFTSTGKALVLAGRLGAEYRSLQQHADGQIAAPMRLASSRWRST